MAVVSLLFYQLEAHVGNTWEPIPGQTYACRGGLFRQMYNLLSPAPGQRLRRVGDSLNFPEAEDWKPSFLYIGKRGEKAGSLRDWPVK
jgi:hypothetical protein